jgi:hypothetical protein
MKYRRVKIARINSFYAHLPLNGEVAVGRLYLSQYFLFRRLRRIRLRILRSALRR